MYYLFESFLDRLPDAVRLRLWDFIFLFMQDDEEWSMPASLPTDTPSAETGRFAWSGSRTAPKPK